MSLLGMLAPDGVCKTFDKSANGYARGEAISAIYIKRLDLAMSDKDPIRAVIRATSSNHGGKGSGLLQPSTIGQEAMIRQAYQAAGVSNLSETCFIMCHGTGTAVGDPVETTAIANVFGGEQDIFIGSVKPNFGHSEGASGITNTIAAVLALEHRTIPPNIHFKNPNPLIPFEEGRLRVALEPTPWPAGRPERVGVSSFGVGGSNVHLILESATSLLQTQRPQAPAAADHEMKLLLFSANTPDSLTRRVDQIQQYYEARPDRIHDLAYTLGQRREHLPYRCFGVAHKDRPLEILAPHRSLPTPSSVIFLFTGQGAQWPGMGVGLMEGFPSFRDDMQRLDQVLQALDQPPNWSLVEELSKDGNESRVYDTELSHPLCTAVQIGLVNLMNRWNIHPSAVIGHSGGETAAAYAARAITMDAAFLVGFYRGQVSKLVTQEGAMAVVGLSAEEITPHLVDGVGIACENSPQNTTISGDAAAVNDVMAQIQSAHPEKLCRKLRVDKAYHSHHLKDLAERYEASMTPYVVSTQPTIPFYSSVTGTVLPNSMELDAHYWRQNYESRVRFRSAIEAILNSGSEPLPKVFLEIGPHSALAGPLREISQQGKLGDEMAYIPTLVRGEEQVKCLLSTAGHIFLQNVPIRLSAINGEGDVLTDVPAYPWQHDSRHWNESRLSRERRLRRFAHHELLGSRVPESAEPVPIWRNILKLENVPWLRDHSIGDKPTFPSSGYVASIGEAIRQVTGCRGYAIRRLVLLAALVLEESCSVEIITGLRPSRLSDRLNSEWFDFTIASYNCSKWITHCTGQARALSITSHRTTLETRPLPRRIQADTWYSAMARSGLHYGPCFRGLRKISAHPSGGRAIACLNEGQLFPLEHYSLHPVLMDQIFQLTLIAPDSVTTNRTAQILIPQAIEHVEVFPIENMQSAISVEALTRETTGGIVYGQARAVVAGGLAVSAKQIKFVPLGIETLGKADSFTISQLEWRPDIDFVSAADLIRAVPGRRDGLLLAEKLCVLCILESAQRVKESNIKHDGLLHLDKYRDWLGRESTRILKGQSIIQEAPELALLKPSARLRLIRELTYRIQNSGDTKIQNLCEPILRVFENCQAIFDGLTDALDILMEDGCLSALYDSMQNMWNLTEYLALLSYSKPQLRVLEVGAGTGATTEAVLKGLRSAEGRPQYSRYTFTDISSGFFASAQERFKQYEGVDYAMLDVGKDPIEQGFQYQSYDLIVAANVLHATPSIRETLQNVKKLIAPRGRLLLLELCTEIRFGNFIMGTLPGWWLGENDQRVEQPFISPERWDKELRAVGLSGAESIAYDDVPPFQFSACIISRNLQEPLHSKELILVCPFETSDEVDNVEKHFLQSGYQVRRSTLESVSAVEGVVIFLLDMEGPFFDGITPQKWIAFREYLSRSKPSATLWVTRPAQMKCGDPRFGLVMGIARTVRRELAHDFATFEVDTLDATACHSLHQVYEKLKKQREHSGMIEYEYSFTNDNIHISRYQWRPATDCLAFRPRDTGLKKLDIERYGQLDTLSFVEDELGEPTVGEVEIEVRCAGLNFRDILISLAIVDVSKRFACFGWEGAGIVTRVGPEAKDVRAGDRVMFLGQGSFSTKVVRSANLCCRIPECMSFEEGATMPLVYTSVIHSLLEAANLQAGQSVLIHSACGGVGLAAIQICQMVGADIYATVGSDKKADYLVANYQIPRNRIFSSRNTSFQGDLMRETNGKGADIVLNSLAGELAQASHDCVAEYGKFIELGTRDILENAILNMKALQSNRTLIGVDMSGIIAQRPSEARRLLERCVALAEQGHIKPIQPLAIFEAEKAQDAFRYMQSGEHIGKIILRFPEIQEELQAKKALPKASFSGGSSYLLAGGLGGLGMSIAAWMVENGARQLVFLSRSAGKSDEDQAFLRELEDLGCNVKAIPGSVANIEDVHKAVAACPAPLAGVIQLSMVLKDRPISAMSYNEWMEVAAPKVTGTWNLHHALGSATLDFFVVLGSIAAAIGSKGQANYTAANTFLSSFVLYRQSLGLPASVVDIGAVEDVGYVSKNADTGKSYRKTGIRWLRERDILEGVQAAVTLTIPTRIPDVGVTNRNHFAIGLEYTEQSVVAQNDHPLSRDIRLSRHSNLRAQNTDQDAQGPKDNLREFLSSVAANPSVLEEADTLALLTRKISVKISSLLLHAEDELDATKSLSALGVDSLGRIEISNWCKASLGLDIGVFDITAAETIAKLAQTALDSLRTKFIK
ncbi:lovastatin nonaketide synthase [Aspergillus udagawae]|nr:lovastatin nonaketide synthase [Aspergillus udagawae]